MVAECKDDDDCDCVALTGFARVTLSLAATFHDDDNPYPCDEIAHTFTTVIPDHAISRKRVPDRYWSAGHILGMELCRLARQLRSHVADWDEVIDGFEQEMREPY